MSLMGSDESVMLVGGVRGRGGALSLCLCLLFEDKRTETWPHNPHQSASIGGVWYNELSSLPTARARDINIRHTGGSPGHNTYHPFYPVARARCTT